MSFYGVLIDATINGSLCANGSLINPYKTNSLLTLSAVAAVGFYRSLNEYYNYVFH